MYGALVGTVVYGVHNGTNYANNGGCGDSGPCKVILFDKDRELEQIPTIRTGPQVMRQVQQYLKNTNVYAYGDRSRTLNCWAEFEGQEFNVEYLNRGSWRIDAYYDLVRYYWRVDDITLEVTRDLWVKTYNPSIGC